MTAIHRIALSLAALVLSLSNVLAYDTPSTDSLLWDWVSLDSAAIATFSPLLSPEQITATRWVSDSVLTNGFGSADVSNALNALPGVLMETRGMGGSRRLNVRGSALRSPFAVRNTMLFIRGFLLTEADGTSPVEWLDPSSVGGMELVSGAAATTFGGAYGGALLTHGAAQPALGRIQTVVGTTGNAAELGLKRSSVAKLGLKRSTEGVEINLDEDDGAGDWEFMDFVNFIGGASVIQAHHHLCHRHRRRHRRIGIRRS